MSNRFHLSYDVIDVDQVTNRSRDVYLSLLRMLYIRLCADDLKRPTASTIVFNTEHNDREVVNVVEEWRKAENVYFYLSLVAENYDGAGSGYIRRNSELDNNVREDYARIIRETVGGGRCSG